jgi:hypothetical protein
MSDFAGEGVRYQLARILGGPHSRSECCAEDSVLARSMSRTPTPSVVHTVTRWYTDSVKDSING